MVVVMMVMMMVVVVMMMKMMVVMTIMMVIGAVVVVVVIKNVTVNMRNNAREDRGSYFASGNPDSRHTTVPELQL